MKYKRILLAPVLLLVLPGTLPAGSSEMEPVFTRYARIYQAPTVDLRAEYFRDKPMEAILEYDFEDYTAFSMAPEMLYSISDAWDVKLAAPFRLTSDGQKYAAELELTCRF